MTSPERPSQDTPVGITDARLEAERGPGLGCFRIQVGLLAFLLVLTPLSVVWRWPSAVSAILLFLVIVLLLFVGQTFMFLLRLVAAGRREGPRHRPLASRTPTVGELDDVAPPDTAADDAAPPDGAAEHALLAPGGTTAAEPAMTTLAEPRTNDPVVRE